MNRLSMHHWWKFHPLLIVAALALILAFSGTRGASANGGSTTFNYLVGSGPICDLEEDACPDISSADNGDTITITGAGTFSTQPKSVTGSGTFIHKDSGGKVLASGTWTATYLLSFKDFGQDPTLGFPASFRGGKALILVELSVGGTPVHTAILTITCDFGSNPPGQEEGARLAVQDALNFSHKVSGLTLFIAQ